MFLKEVNPKGGCMEFIGKMGNSLGHLLLWAKLSHLLVFHITLQLKIL